MSVTIVGNVNVDVIATPVAELPAPGTERVVDRIAMRPGGAGTIAALALARLGVPARLVGCVGDDAVGRFLLDDLERGGVRTKDVRVLPGEATGVCIALESPGRDRSFLMASAALAHFDASMVPADALRGADQALFGGWFLLPALRGEPTSLMLREVREAGGRTLLDTGWDPEGWPPPIREELLAVLPLVDVCIPNAAEAMALSGEGDTIAGARSLAGRSGGWVVVKLGADGCLGAGPGGESFTFPAPRVAGATDTTGAGDSFNAGLIAALERGDDVPEAAVFALRVASTVVGRPSADRYPRVEELVG